MEIGNALVGFLLLFALKAFFLLLFPPKRVILTDKQRKLLGIPAGVEYTSGETCNIVFLYLPVGFFSLDNIIFSSSYSHTRCMQAIPS